MPDSDNLNYLFFGLDSVHKSTWTANYFSDMLVIKFRDSPARFWELGEPLHNLKKAPDEPSTQRAPKSVCKPLGKFLFDLIMRNALALVELP